MLKEWSSVLLSVQAALLALLAVFGNFSHAAKADCFFAIFVVALAASSLFSANVVGAIPSMMQDLATRPVDDVYQMRNRWGINLSLLAFGQHIFFAIGIICLALFLVFGRPATEVSEEPNHAPEPTRLTAGCSWR